MGEGKRTVVHFPLSIRIETLWGEQSGSDEVGGNVRAALHTIDKNEEYIKMSLAVLLTPE